MKEMSGVLWHLCAHVSCTGPGEPSEMTLPARHKIRNLSPGGPLGREGSPQYWIFTSERPKNMLFLWNLDARAGFEPTISDFPSRQLWPLHQGLCHRLIERTALCLGVKGKLESTYVLCSFTGGGGIIIWNPLISRREKFNCGPTAVL